MSSKRSNLLYASLAFIVVLFCCFFPFSPLSLIWDGIVFPAWRDMLVLDLSHTNLPKPILLRSGLPVGAHTLYWSPDASSLFVLGTDWEVGNTEPNNFIISLDSETGEILDERRFNSDYDIQSAYHLESELLYRRTEKAFWATCTKQDLVISGSELSENVWELELRQNDVVVGNYKLFSNQWSEPQYPPQISGFNFSPTCEYFAITIGGWIYHEGDGQGELWLLNINTQSFEQVLKGRWPFSRTWDYPTQDIMPSWSPDGNEFVFGDNNFGLEIYDVNTHDRRWLANDKQSGYDPSWSPSGRWIAANRYWDFNTSIVMISTISKSIDFTGQCYFPYDKAWADTDDQLAYLCADTIGGEPKLWVWSIPNE